MSNFAEHAKFLIVPFKINLLCIYIPHVILIPYFTIYALNAISKIRWNLNEQIDYISSFEDLAFKNHIVHRLGHAMVHTRILG